MKSLKGIRLKTSEMQVTLIDSMGSDLKKCQSCCEIKEKSEFPVRNDRSGRLRPYCKVCASDIAKARYKYHRESSPFVHKCTRARSRSSSLGIPFNLTPEYLESIWTGVCPVFKHPISLTGDRKNEFTAELDRFIPELGYVKGNVHFLSRRANRLKNNVSSKELQQLLEWMLKNENK